MWDTHLGEARSHGARFSFTWFAAEGTGALGDKDGLSATAYPSGIAGVPIEIIESIAPVVMRRRELRADSGGAGRWRGGLDQTMEFEVLTDRPFLFSGWYERTQFAAPGLAGGGRGALGRLSFDNDAGLAPKMSGILPSATVVTLELPGGGGYGPATERDPERVLVDVRDGYISAEASERLYGAVIDTTDWTVSAGPTAQARERMRLGTLP